MGCPVIVEWKQLGCLKNKKAVNDQDTIILDANNLVPFQIGILKRILFCRLQSTKKLCMEFCHSSGMKLVWFGVQCCEMLLEMESNWKSRCKCKGCKIYTFKKWRKINCVADSLTFHGIHIQPNSCKSLISQNLFVSINFRFPNY